jgi:hypothetical protein
VIKNTIDFIAIRQAIANFELSPRVEPNEPIRLDRAFLPGGHRGVLDFRRQLVVGNRGMGKSFWTHALLSAELRERLADFYGHKQLKSTRVEIGFNGSTKVGTIAPTTDEISGFYVQGRSPDLIWRGVFLRTAFSILKTEPQLSLASAMDALERDPSLYSINLSRLDDMLAREGQYLLIVFDALDRLGQDWGSIRGLTRALLGLAVGLQSFSSIRAKIFMRVDQFSDQELFRFPDSSKIRNDHVNLIWRPNELYGLLLFEILRDERGGAALQALANKVNAVHALPSHGADCTTFIEEQTRLIEAIAGEFMGSNKKRGRVYSWVPLHLSDAANTCSPRSFLVAWKKAAEHYPPPLERALDHLGLLDGVRSASASRLGELYEDYPWIQIALAALRRQFVPMDREQLLDLWVSQKVLLSITGASGDLPRNAPVGLVDGDELNALLTAMKNVAVMEERINGKINVPDIFRVEAGILRKGGVAVPRRA